MGSDLLIHGAGPDTRREPRTTVRFPSCSTVRTSLTQRLKDGPSNTGLHVELLPIWYAHRASLSVYFPSGFRFVVNVQSRHRLVLRKIPQ